MAGARFFWSGRVAPRVSAWPYFRSKTLLLFITKKKWSSSARDTFFCFHIHCLTPFLDTFGRSNASSFSFRPWPNSLSRSPFEFSIVDCPTPRSRADDVGGCGPRPARSQHQIGFPSPSRRRFGEKGGRRARGEPREARGTASSRASPAGTR